MVVLQAIPAGDLDAYQLLTQAGGLSVAQMVNPTYTAVASCPRRYLRR